MLVLLILGQAVQQIGIYRCVRTAPKRIVLSTFSKVVPCAQQRPPRRRIGVSFWELFLCAYAVKEKVDEKVLVSKVSLPFITLFSLAK